MDHATLRGQSLPRTKKILSLNFTIDRKQEPDDAEGYGTMAEGYGTCLGGRKPEEDSRDIGGLNDCNKHHEIPKGDSKYMDIR